jgi:hypothetical protein
MRRALIFNGVFIAAAASLVFFLRGKQVRKEVDEQMLLRSLHARTTGDMM